MPSDITLSDLLNELHLRLEDGTADNGLTLLGFEPDVVFDNINGSRSERFQQFHDLMSAIDENNLHSLAPMIFGVQVEDWFNKRDNFRLGAPMPALKKSGTLIGHDDGKPEQIMTEEKLSHLFSQQFQKNLHQPNPETED